MLLLNFIFFYFPQLVSVCHKLSSGVSLKKKITYAYNILYIILYIWQNYYSI